MQRPKEFDAQVVAYLPALRNVARRLVQHEDIDDLVSETAAALLRRWDQFRLDGAFYSWAVLVMRGIAAEARKRKKLNTVSIDTDTYVGCTQPAQEEIVFAGQVVSYLSCYKEGQALLMRTVGDTLDEVGEVFGVGKSRVGQFADSARADVHRMAA